MEAELILRLEDEKLKEDTATVDVQNDELTKGRRTTKEQERWEKKSQSSNKWRLQILFDDLFLEGL